MPKVYFRGPMLTVRRGLGSNRTIKSILIPEGRVPVDYPDDTPSRPHTAGMFVVVGGVEGPVFPLTGFNVAIDDGSGLPCGADSSLDRKVLLHRLVDNGPEALHPVTARTPMVASIVTLAGGTLAIEPMTDSVNPYNFPVTFSKTPLPQQHIPLISVWSTLGTVTVTPEEGEAIHLTGSDELYIFNFDKPSNSVTFYRTILDICPIRGNAASDEDFKWVYHVFKVPVVTWKTWRGTDPLPTPVLSCGARLLDPSGKLAIRIVNRTSDSAEPSPDDGDCIDGIWDVQPGDD